MFYSLDSPTGGTLRVVIAHQVLLTKKNVNLTMGSVKKPVMDGASRVIMLLYLDLPRHQMQVLCPGLGIALKKHVC